tara:strand:+ start:1933 stop:2283 length:351 start_codon:yes stop_codon:yes gene_type:complete
MTTILGTPSYTYIEPNFTALRPCRTEIVGCHNLASARAIAEGRAPELNDDDGSFTYPAKAAFRSPSGQYYVTVELHPKPVTTVRIDCANQATARHYYRNGVPTWLVAEELVTSLNR